MGTHGNMRVAFFGSEMAPNAAMEDLCRRSLPGGAFFAEYPALSGLVQIAFGREAGQRSSISLSAARSKIKYKCDGRCWRSRRAMSSPYSHARPTNLTPKRAAVGRTRLHRLMGGNPDQLALSSVPTAPCANPAAWSISWAICRQAFMLAFEAARADC